MARAIPGVRDLVARSSVEPVTIQGVFSVGILERQLFRVRWGLSEIALSAYPLEIHCKLRGLRTGRSVHSRVPFEPGLEFELVTLKAPASHICRRSSFTAGGYPTSKAKAEGKTS